MKIQSAGRNKATAHCRIVPQSIFSS